MERAERSEHSARLEHVWRVGNNVRPQHSGNRFVCERGTYAGKICYGAFMWCLCCSGDIPWDERSQILSRSTAVLHTSIEWLTSGSQKTRFQSNNGARRGEHGTKMTPKAANMETNWCQKRRKYATLHVARCGKYRPLVPQRAPDLPAREILGSILGAKSMQTQSKMRSKINAKIDAEKNMKIHGKTSKSRAEIYAGIWIKSIWKIVFLQKADLRST